MQRCCRENFPGFTPIAFASRIDHWAISVHSGRGVYGAVVIENHSEDDFFNDQSRSE